MERQIAVPVRPVFRTFVDVAPVVWMPDVSMSVFSMPDGLIPFVLMPCFNDAADCCVIEARMRNIAM